MTRGLFPFLLGAHRNDIAFGLGECAVGSSCYGENEIHPSVVIQLPDIIVADVSGKFAGSPLFAKPDIVPDQTFEVSAVVLFESIHQPASGIVIFHNDHLVFFILIQIGDKYPLLKELAFKSGGIEDLAFRFGFFLP